VVAPGTVDSGVLAILAAGLYPARSRPRHHREAGWRPTITSQGWRWLPHLTGHEFKVSHRARLRRLPDRQG
jgi:hypothetical protein